MSRSYRSRWILLAALACAAACSAGDPASPESGGVRGPGTASDGEGSRSPAATADVGTVTIHRLNAVEFDNTARDLVGATTRYSATFPPDDGAEGFTNNADALSISPLLLERYEAAAAGLAATAVASSRIMTCDEIAAGAAACAEEILSRFLVRAWRRAVGADEVARLVALVEQSIEAGDTFVEALEIAIKSALLSPSFLFRIEVDPDPTAKTPRKLDDYELASRLSYFLWSTMPDDALFAYAGAHRLSDPRIFEMQIRRMLRDPKAAALVDNFAAQWLLHGIHDAAPDVTVFPSFDDGLKTSMEAETKAFLGSFVLGGESLDGLLDAPFTFIDSRMAAHYGLPGSFGSAPVRVTLPAGSHRAGLLTHASVLTMTSVARRTSPVRRGEWILAELLCSPPPPPPPGIPALEERAAVGTIRQRMEQHRQNPICASCHSAMDPLGFALERYDALGRWRDTDEGLPIDTSGELPGGEKIDGAVQLAAALKKDPRFGRCATRKLYAYALGRSPAAFDEERIASLASAFMADRYRVTNLIVEIVHSDAFLMRRGSE